MPVRQKGSVLMVHDCAGVRARDPTTEHRQNGYDSNDGGK